MHGSLKQLPKLATDADTSDALLQAWLTGLAALIKVEHAEYLRKTRESAAHAIRAGELLLQAKAAVRHGEWEDRLLQLCRDVGFKDRTARLYMQLAERVASWSPAKRQRAADLSQRRVLEQLAGREHGVEHYTPLDIIAAVTRVFGGPIDLDPASCEAANRRVKARRYFTREQYGLRQPWMADNGFLNPPFCGQAAAWVEKALQEYHAGNIKALIILLNATGYRTETSWSRQLDDYLYCRPRDRLRFTGPDARACPVPTLLFYLGPDGAAFRREFDPLFGPVKGRLETFFEAGMALPPTRR